MPRLRKAKRSRSGHGMQGMRIRRRSKIKNSLLGITNSALRRLARRGGVKRISFEVYDEARDSLKNFLKILIEKSTHYTKYHDRRTITSLDVVYALKHMGRTIYGFGG